MIVRVSPIAASGGSRRELRVAQQIPGDRPLSLRIGIHQHVVAPRDRGACSSVCASLRIGIHQPVGARRATVGAFGGRRRTDYTVLGIGVKFAARFEQACPPGCILASQTVWNQLRVPPVAEPRELQLEGIPGTVRAYAITPGASAAS